MYPKEENDSRLLQVIKDCPGITIMELINGKFGDDISQVWYHVGRLESSNKIKVAFNDRTPKYTELTLT